MPHSSQVNGKKLLSRSAAATTVGSPANRGIALTVIAFVIAAFTATFSQETSEPHTVPDSLHQDVKTVIPAGIFYGSFSKDDGPFLVEGSIIVPSGQTLEFGPGSVVYVGGTYSTITVFGQMTVRGTPSDPVVFMSAKRSPDPWDWDRIYCRSRNSSVFEHCIIRHSNHGITVENGLAEIRHCVFERNSLFGVAVKNADVTIASSTVSRGHVMGILLSAGAHVRGDSLVISDNTTGIGCDGKSVLELSGGTITGNVNGIVATADASITLRGTEVSHNKVGIITEKAIPRKNRATVFNNGSDEKIVGGEAIREYLKEPETVSTVVFPASPAPVATKAGFSEGFSATTAADEAASSFIGNITAGFRFFRPETFRHPRRDTLVAQTIFPDGLQPEVQVFAAGKRGNTDVNLLMDIYANSWLMTEGYFGKNMLNLGLTYDNHTLSFGDFFESGSETSINGRQMTGIKYTGYYWDMGDGMRRMEYRLAAGESEIPRDSGRHDLRQYNVTVDSGMSMRQQITYIMATTIRPTRTTTFSAEGIIARDQVDKPLFRTVLSDPGAPKPVEAQTGVLSGTMSLLRGKLELFTEIDLGRHDTITDSLEARSIAWYNPELEDALPKIFRNFLSVDDFRKHYAVTAGGKAFHREYVMQGQFTEIGPRYFSAGNPYLEANRRFVRAGVERQIDDYRFASGMYEYERTMSTGTPTDRNTVMLRADYGTGENRPAFSVNTLSRYETTTMSERFVVTTASADGRDSATYAAYEYRKVTNSATFEGKQNLPGGISYSASYQLLWDNDISTHANIENTDIGDRFQHQMNGWVTFRYKRFLRNKTALRLTLKDENRDSLNSLAFKFSDQLALTIIPRKLTLNITGEVHRKTEQEFSADTLSVATYGWQDPVLTSYYGGEAEVKYSLTPRLTFTLKGRYEKSYDEIPTSRDNYRVAIAGLQMTWLF